MCIHTVGWRQWRVSITFYWFVECSKGPVLVRSSLRVPNIQGTWRKWKKDWEKQPIFTWNITQVIVSHGFLFAPISSYWAKWFSYFYLLKILILRSIDFSDDSPDSNAGQTYVPDKDFHLSLSRWDWYMYCSSIHNYKID